MDVFRLSTLEKSFLVLMWTLSVMVAFYAGAVFNANEVKMRLAPRADYCEVPSYQMEKCVDGKWVKITGREWAAFLTVYRCPVDGP